MRPVRYLRGSLRCQRPHPRARERRPRGVGSRSCWRSSLGSSSGSAASRFNTPRDCRTSWCAHGSRRHPYVRVVEVGEDDTDPAKWGKNWPAQYDGYKRTAIITRTRFGGHGGSEAMPEQKIDRDPWLKRMFLGYAFSIDYRDRRSGYRSRFRRQHRARRRPRRQRRSRCPRRAAASHAGERRQ
jgi:hypothetical protein